MMNDVLFGIRKNVLEDADNRAFLKEYLPNRNMALSVITGIISGCIVDMHSCIPTYKPLDLTQLPSPESKEWQKALTLLIKSEKGNNVIWFDSEERAIFYIESTYPNDSKEKK